MLLKALQWVALLLGGLMVAGTLLSFSRSARWWVRIWDFPRVQIAVIAAVSGGVYTWLFYDGGWPDWAFVISTGAVALWQTRKILAYTPLARVQVQRTEPGKGPCLRLVISNVLMSNRQYDRWLRVVRAADPDVILAVETDDGWARALAPLAETYPHGVAHPQDNYYGLMLFSRLPLPELRVEFLVQDDIPSVHARIQLKGGVEVMLHGLHPRPPEPIRDQDATPRDAELVLVGRTIGDGPDLPTVVAGDLNDVAWSPSSELFLRLSGLLDPRVGRGLFNSYDATNPVMRYPLDHVFHSHHFRLLELRRLDNVGSDHFPMLVELSYEPDAAVEQPEQEEEPGDHEAAEEKIEEQVEAARTGDDRPGRPE